MVTTKLHNVKVYAHCLSYFIFVLQNGVLRGMIWYWVPYFTHEFIYFSSLRNNIFSFFCAPVGILKTIPSVHTTVSVCEENPAKFFHVQTAVTAASPKRNSHLLGHYNDFSFFFLRSKYFISGELAVIVIKWRVFATLTEIFKERL